MPRDPLIDPRFGEGWRLAWAIEAMAAPGGWLVRSGRPEAISAVEVALEGPPARP